MYSAATKVVQPQCDEAGTQQFELLVERATRGDADALSELCEKIAKSILFQVTFMLGDFTDAEDVSQNILVCVCKNIGDLRSPKAFKVWLTRIIINEKNRYLRDKMRHRTLLNIDDYLGLAEENPGFLPQERVESEELRSAVREAVSRLPMRQCESTILHYYHGMRVTKIAQARGVTKPSITKHLVLARSKLKCNLQGMTAG